MAEPIKPTNYISEVLTGQTAAQWAASGGSVRLEAFETVIESDTGKRKTGPGLFSELPYDNPQGQTWQNTSGTPDANDLIGYTAVTPAVTATAEWTCDDVGTAGATIIVGNKLYTVVASGATGDQIDAGATATEYADNIATKVTTDTADTLCTAENASAVITFTANTTGAVGNDIPLSTTDENITADVFVDGADAIYTPKATSALALAGGNGDVSGPASSTDNAIARFDSTTGKLIQNSAAFVDDNGNVYAPNVAGGSVSIATAAGTTTLTVASKGTQVFTGVTTQTIVLPVVTTLPQIGFGYHIINDSTGALTVNSSGANLVQTIPAGGRALITCILLTGTTAASWASTFTNAATSAGALSGATIATAAANTSDLGLANTAFVQGQGQGYLVYDATLTQTSTNAPVATVGQNNIGQTMTWARSNTGEYTVTAGAAAFTANKTQVFIGPLNPAGFPKIVRTSTTVITITTYDEAVSETDDRLLETAIRIVIFP